MSKKDKVLNELKKGKKVTGKSAMKFGLYRLSSAIHQLRNEGYKIECNLVFNKKKKEHYGEYTLRKK